MTTPTDTRTEAELQAAILDGDTSITADDLRAARDREQLAGLHAEADRRGAAAQAEADRRAALRQLRTEIEGYTSAGAPSLAELAQGVVDAVTALRTGIEARNNQVTLWVERARALGAPNHEGLHEPPAEHEGVGVATPAAGIGTRLVVGRRRFGSTNVDQVVEQAVGAWNYGRPVTFVPPNRDDVVAQLAAVDAEHETPADRASQGVRFFRGEGGAVHAFDEAAVAAMLPGHRALLVEVNPDGTDIEAL